MKQCEDTLGEKGDADLQPIPPRLRSMMNLRLPQLTPNETFCFAYKPCGLGHSSRYGTYLCTLAKHIWAPRHGLLGPI